MKTKDEKKRFYIQLIADIIIIAAFILLSMQAKNEFNNGARFVLQNVPAYCYNFSMYEYHLKYFNVTIAPNETNYFPSLSGLLQK
jgi:hypothetical protein